MIINDFNTKAVHTFQVRTLNEFGFNTRVTLSNNSHTNSKFSTSYRVDLRIYNNINKETKYIENISFIDINNKVTIDCQTFLENKSDEYILIFYLIPIKHIENNKIKDKINISKAELWYLITAQDHYVEYYNKTNFSSGVLYQCGAFNYEKFSRENTTIIQAPKCYISEEINTYISLINSSPIEDYKTTAIIKCSLINEKYNPIISWEETVKPFETKLINVKNKLQESKFDLSELSFSCFYGICKNATLLPLTLNYNEKKSTLAVEHSLPPNYYGGSFHGDVRAQNIKKFYDSEIFN